MVPHLIYHKAFKMDDGSAPDLTVGKEYELNCVLITDEVMQYQILDDRCMVHGFFSDEEWFSEHFTIVGDIDSVTEEF